MDKIDMIYDTVSEIKSLLTKQNGRVRCLEEEQGRQDERIKTVEHRPSAVKAVLWCCAIMTVIMTVLTFARG
jgi:hypothetical protein